jgi:two-component system, LytTR family, response regulator
MHKTKCIIVDDEPTAREILQLLIEQIENLEIVAFCKNAMEVFSVLNKNDIDLIFLDINMPDMSGISLAKSIPKTTKIIFTTAYRDYAVDGFDLQAVDYLLKPISLERLVQAIQKYHLEHKSSDNNIIKDYLVVRSNRKMIKINLSNIIYIESLSDYLKIHTNNNKTVITRETISNIESKLSKKTFIRIHRSFIVSIPFISSYTAEYVTLEDKTITISRSYRNSFLKRLEADY